jgi:hypothetical protein
MDTGANVLNAPNSVIANLMFGAVEHEPAWLPHFESGAAFHQVALMREQIAEHRSLFVDRRYYWRSTS